MSFLPIRLRRNRKSSWARALVREHSLSVNDLIWPIFIIEGESQSVPIAAMQGVHRYSIDQAVIEIKKAHALGILAIALFPVMDIALKNEQGSEALNPENLICRACRAIKQAVPDIGVITDVALDPYTSHGHDGLLQNGMILNDETVDILCKQAVVQAKAGADVIAPSDMMDGRIRAIRVALDEAGFSDVQIMSYAAKYASCFYGPFRDAVGSNAALKGDKRTYQMDCGNGAEALREAEFDVAEGADMLIVKPGMPYLDVLYRVKQAFQMPTFAYQVSGEYAMIEAASSAGFIDRDAAILESLMAFKRAGADGVLTYFAVRAAELLAR